jgi:high-affinity iron transporter
MMRPHRNEGNEEMLAPLLIMVREGFEAALIVGIIGAYLVQTGRKNLLPAMWVGVAGGILFCAVVGVALTLTSRELDHRAQEMMEAIIGLVAVAMLTYMAFWMRGQARHIKGELQSKVEAATRSTWAFALPAMAFFAVLREGIESVLFLLASFQQQNVGIEAPIGAILGTLIAIGLGAAIFLGGKRIDMRRFFAITGGFIMVVAAGFLAGSLHHLHEAGVWNALQTQMWDTSGIVDGTGTLGSVLRGLMGYNPTPTLGELIVYLGYLLPVIFLFYILPRFERTPHAPAKATISATR